MSYRTEFHGAFAITPVLKPVHAEYLRKFAEIRHMQWDTAAIQEAPDPVRKAAGIRSVGNQGAFFVGFDSDLDALSRLAGVADINAPAKGVPGLKCMWCPSFDGTALVWDGNDNFYDYVEWLDYLIETFFDAWGYKLNGQVFWDGQDTMDLGRLVVTNNSIDVQHGVVTYESVHE